MQSVVWCRFLRHHVAISTLNIVPYLNTIVETSPPAWVFDVMCP